MNQLPGFALAGTSVTRDRAENDYYATPQGATKALLEVEEIKYPVLEPACGEGHISRLLTGGTVYSSDLVDRGYGIVKDFLKDETHSVETILTNPPFFLFQEFAEKALKIATHKVILFGKIQALEGERRGTFMQNSPLKTVYVFKKRQNPLRNGSAVDEKGKPWASTMCFAWYVWEIGYIGSPTIKWL